MRSILTILLFCVLMPAVGFGLRVAGLSSVSDSALVMLPAMVCLVVSFLVARKIVAKLPAKDKSKWWWKL